MKVNLSKTWELLLRGKTTRTPPEPLEIIGRKEKLKLLGVSFEQVPVNWDTHIDYLLRPGSHYRQNCFCWVKIFSQISVSGTI